MTPASTPAATAQSPEDSPVSAPPPPTQTLGSPGWGLYLQTLSCCVLLLLGPLFLGGRAAWGWASWALLPPQPPLLEAGDGLAVLLPLGAHHLAAQVPAGGTDLKDGLRRGHRSPSPRASSSQPGPRQHGGLPVAFFPGSFLLYDVGISSLEREAQREQVTNPRSHS